MRIVLPNDPACESSASDSRTSSPRPRIGSSASTSSGSSTKMRLDLLVDRRGQQRERLGARVLGREVRVGRVGAEHGVHRAGHLAEPLQAREEARRAPTPARRARAPSRRRAPRTYSCRTPSVVSSGRPTYAYQPASRAMFSKPRSVRKRSSSSSGLTPGSSRRKTLRISSSSKTIDVFDCSRPMHARSRAARSRAGESLERAELEHAFAGAATLAPARIMCTSSRT